MTDNVHQRALAALSGTQLAEVHNRIPGVRAVARFSDLQTARLRVDRALAEAGLKLSYGGEIVPHNAITVTRSPATAGKFIVVLAEKNPKAPGSKSHARFELYRTGMTMREYRDAAFALHPGLSKQHAMRDLYWDRDHGYIRISQTPVD